MRALASFGGAGSVWFSGLSRRPARICLTIVGISAGVALSFAVGAQNASLTSGTAKVYHELAGRSTLELVALGPEGMPSRVVTELRHTSGVAAVAPVAESFISLHHGHRAIGLRLFGVDSDIRTFGGPIASAVPSSVELSPTIGLYLPSHVAGELNAHTETILRADTRVGSGQVHIAGTIPPQTLRGIATAPVGFTLLSSAQLLAGTIGRVQRVLILPRRSSKGLLRSLQHVGGPGTVVWSASDEIRAANQASALTRSSSLLFATLSLVLGALLAYSAMTLTMAERRREASVLRLLGCDVRTLLLVVLADALLVGIAGSAVGLLIGRLALGWLLPSDNAFLSAAFILNTQLYVPTAVIFLSLAAGVATTLLAVALPARALVQVAPAEVLRTSIRSSPLKVTPSTRILLASALLVGTLSILLTISGAGLVGVPLWTLAGLLAVPAVVSLTARLLLHLLPSPSGPVRVGIAEIANFPARAIATAAVVMLAISGLVTVRGTVVNLETGVARLATETYPRGNLFVTAATDNQVFPVRPLPSDLRHRLTLQHDVSSVRRWPMTFLDWKDRRVLAFSFVTEAHGTAGGAPRDGHPGQAARTLQANASAVALSRDLTLTLGLHIGDHFAIPTPVGPKMVHLAALISNYGWQPGAVAFNPASYEAWWGSRYTTLYEVSLKPGAAPTTVAARLSRSLSPFGIVGLTAEQMRERVSQSAKAQFAPFRKIGQFIALSGLLAVTAAILAGILGRLRRLSALRTIGMSTIQLAIALASETACIVVTGSLLGGAVGVVGQALVIHYLSTAFALNAKFSPLWAQLAVGVELSGAMITVATVVALHRTIRTPIGKPA